MATKNSAGGFKQMPKMETTEPSVILKMKKGGHVNTKQATKGEHGHSPMSTAKHRESMEGEHGASPKKPSMAERKRAMNPNFKDGGKVAHKAMGGMMGGPNPQAMAAMANPAIRAALAKRAMAQRAMAGATAAPMGGLQPGMKKGGEVAKLEKELKRHESMKAGKAHHGLKAGGSLQKKAEAFETKTTIEHDEKPYVSTKMDTAKKDRAHGTGMVREGKPGGYAAGGTITGNAKQYENTKMHDGDRKDTAHGTGGIRVSNAGGFAKGGTITGGNWENRPANGTPKGVVNTKTGEVKEANAGGFKHGGKASKKAYATGGSVNDQGKAVKMPRHFVSQPVANSLQSGTFKDGGAVAKKAKGGTSTYGGSTPMRLLKTHTGPKGHVAKVYKDKDWGEHRVKFYSPEGKHYSEADYHTDDLSDAHDTAKGQLNRYKVGGKAKKFEDGGSTSDDKYIVKDPKAVSDKASRDLEEAMNPLSMAKELYGKAKNYFSPPAGSVTKTEKSITVAPGKRHGGSARK